MTPFLKNIAKTYYENHKADISAYSFVFPNRRSGLFFRKYLGEMLEKPLFSPKILTINELFLSQSALRLTDKLELLFRVYNIYKAESKSDETFDVFAFWGEMLLGDFDDVDKYLVDAKQLFTNLRELKEIDNLFDYLSAEQIEAIRSFWSSFTPTAESKNRQDFLSTWQLLYPVYEKLHAELRQNGVGYEGMIFRDIVEKIKQGEKMFTGYEKIIFVGFNALTPCEKEVFKYLKKNGKADFYWDYSSPQTRETDNPASLFFRENVSAFPSKYDILEDEKNNEEPVIAGSVAEHSQSMTRNFPTITLTGIPSAVGQAKEVYNILKELDLNEQSAFQTAVVLPEEKFLLPLLHSLPETIENVNITMGYPLSFTPLAGLIDAVFELQRNIRRTDGTLLFYYKNVLAILNHPYILRNAKTEIREIVKEITTKNRFYIAENDLQKTDLLRSIFSVQSSPAEIATYLLRLLEKLQTHFSDNNNSLEREFIYHYYIAVKRIADLLEQWKIEMSEETFFRLLRKLAADINIPFSGEPLSGLQIMGVLETRAIDFDTLIITSMNEGIFPKKQSAPSFVPYSLRKGFGMPTTEHQDSIFAYHFYRLIHRAKKIFFLYDTRTEGLQSGEVSRFVHQLRYLYKVPVKEKLVTYDISTTEKIPLTVAKTPEIMQSIARFYSQDEEQKQSLSASAINTYLDCPLKFYFAYIEKLKEINEISENVEANDFGTIFHAVMQFIYDEQSADIQSFTPEILREIANNDFYIEKQIKEAFAKKYFKIFEEDKKEKLQLRGQYAIIVSILKKYVKQMLRVDARYAPFTYIQSEFKLDTTFPIGEKSVNLLGYIDRIDEKNGNTRIIDYKTGGNVKTKFTSVEQLFEREKYGRPKEILQLFMYALLYPTQNISPVIIHLRSLFDGDFYNKATITGDFEMIKDDFRQAFIACLEEIFDEQIPFCQTGELRFCEYCAFREICKR